jgi:hypothetical protein
LLGIQTDNSLATQVTEQHIVAINTVATKAAQECGWVNAQRRVTVILQAEQKVLNYPSNCGPGNVRAIAVYDEDRYWPLEPGIIPVHADQDQEQAEGGDTFDSVQGRPRIWEQREQIELYPYSDKQYPVRIDYLAPITMPTEGTVSIIDAQLIIHGTVSMIAQQMGDKEMRDYHAALYVDRMRALMAWQSQGTTVPLSSEADLGEHEVVMVRAPNWARSPTVR